MSGRASWLISGLSVPARVDLQSRANNSAVVAVTAADRAPLTVHVTCEGDGFVVSAAAWPHRKRVRAIRAGNQVWVLVDGEAFVCETDRPVRRDAARGSDELRAPMPATVVRVPVERGQKVEKDATLIVLEAMKMEMSLKAPHAGVVTRLECRPGQLVSPDDVMVVVEPSS